MLTLTSCAATDHYVVPALDLAPVDGPRAPKIRTDETNAVYMAAQDLALDRANSKLAAASEALSVRQN